MYHIKKLLVSWEGQRKVSILNILKVKQSPLLILKDPIILKLYEVESEPISQAKKLGYHVESLKVLFKRF